MTSSPSQPKKVPLRVRLPFSTEQEFIERYGANVTRGGIFIATRGGKPEGTALSFELVLQDGTRLMRGEGVVHRLVLDEQPGKAGMLVRFTRIDPRTLALIDQLLALRESQKPASEPELSPRSRAAEPEPPPEPAEAPRELVLGIDLGTTTCRAAVVVDGQPRLVPIGSERDAFVLPSVVAFDAAKDRVLIGSAARKHRVDHPEATVTGFKRLMGRRAQSRRLKALAGGAPWRFAPDPEGDVGVELGGRVFGIAELASHLLRELKNAAQNHLGRELHRAVLCVPAWYTDHQRTALLGAARLAGLEVLSILNEPSAVALAFGYGRGLARKRVLVYDLGGGTFDASVVEITGDDLEAVSTGGDNFLGGMDFDARLADALIGTMETSARARLLESGITVERVRDAAEVAKIKLSEEALAPVHVPFASTDDAGNPLPLHVEVERGFLESATADLVQRTCEVTQAVLDAARLSPQSLDEVLLVGGQSRAPAVRDALTHLLGRGSRALSRLFGHGEDVLDVARHLVGGRGALRPLAGAARAREAGPLAGRGAGLSHRRRGEGRRLSPGARAQHPPARPEVAHGAGRGRPARATGRAPGHRRARRRQRIPGRAHHDLRARGRAQPALRGGQRRAPAAHRQHAHRKAARRAVLHRRGLRRGAGAAAGRVAAARRRRGPALHAQRPLPRHQAPLRRPLTHLVTRARRLTEAPSPFPAFGYSRTAFVNPTGVHMPAPITDRRLSQLYASYERAARPIGKEQALDILSYLGDSARWGQVKLADALKKPGLSAEQQIALARDGITANERRDLETILDKGSVPLEAGAREFLEQVLGRTPPPAAEGLSVTGDQKHGLSGVTKAGASIEAINISTAPGGRLHLDDTMVIGTADANGRFNQARLTGEQAPREGDLIRMRARYADGSTSDWVTVKASGIEARDTRNAVVALFRVGLADAGDGKISVSNINGSRQVSEPGAQLQFTNKRTGEKTVVTLNDEGSFPAGVSLNGRPGDAFSVAASDGVNNATFTESVGNVTVPGAPPGDVDLVPDPALHRDELDSSGKPRFNKVRFTGPLFVDGVAPGDAQQGQIGDCYFPAAISAIAQSNPSALTNMIKDNGDGTYTVTFKQRDWATGQPKDVPITVDGDLYARSYGGPLYGRSANSGDPKKMELWFPLVEKAYAQWKGSYDTIGDGGHVSDVFEDVLGTEASMMGIGTWNQDRVWTQLVANVDAKKAVGAGTYGDSENGRYTNSGVYANHAYSILGYEQADGERYVVLRNPWGESEPAGNGADDGVFKLKLADFTNFER